MRVLIVDEHGEDRAEIANRVEQALGPIDWVEAGTPETYQKALDDAAIDLVLTESTLSWSAGLSVLQDVRTRMPGVPVIMVTGSGSEILAVEGLKAGLADYVPKDHLARLAPAIRNASAEAPGEAALQQSRQALAAEGDILRRLQAVSAQLIHADTMDTVVQEIVDAAMAILDVDFGSMHLFRPELGHSGELELVAHRGFDTHAVRYWGRISRTSRTTCGLALRTRQRVVAPDIRTCESMAGSDDRSAYLLYGIEAGQSTPLLSRSGELLGMLSTYWRRPHAPTAGDLWALDVLARLAANLLQHTADAQALRESEERYRALNEANQVLVGEVNHRVKNSLTAILSLIFAEQRRLAAEGSITGGSSPGAPSDGASGNVGLPRCQTALNNLSKRIRSLAAVHGLLSSGQWQPLPADVLVSTLIRESLAAGQESRRLRLQITGEPVLISPQQAPHLALVIDELTTNTAKYGCCPDELRISVDVKLDDGEVRLIYGDLGSGYPERVLAGEGHSVGLRLIKTLATHSLRGAWSIRNEDGAVSEIRFPIGDTTSRGWRTGITTAA